MVQGNYKYDAFISYSSKDRAWANELSFALEKKGFTPFLDNNRLIAGDVWEPKLLSSLQQSRNLIVLWSENASQSNWVREEYTRFDQICLDTKREGRIITVLLEGENRRFESYQMIKDIQVQRLYEPGFAALNPNVWDDVMEQVARALKADDTSIPISLAILAATRAELEEVQSDASSTLGYSLDHLLSKMGLQGKEDLLKFYGNSRRNWQPFHGNSGFDMQNQQYIIGHDIITIMNTFKDDFNRRSQAITINWRLIDDVFWSEYSKDEGKVEREAEKFLPLPLDPQSLSVVVIDPVSLYCRLIKSRYDQYIPRWTNNSKCLIMVLPPFPIPDPTFYLRDFIRRSLAPIYDSFYLHIDIPHAGTNCNLQINNDLDMKRFLLSNMKASFQYKRVEDTQTPLTRVGG